MENKIEKTLQSKAVWSYFVLFLEHSQKNTHSKTDTKNQKENRSSKRIETVFSDSDKSMFNIDSPDRNKENTPEEADDFLYALPAYRITVQI